MTTTGQRRYDIDWLRVFATGVVLFFHCARFFDEEGWHVKNPQTSELMGVFIGITVQWMMPLFFVLSAFGVCIAIRNRSSRAYLVERVRRLLVPFVFGTFVLIPPQVYIERHTQDGFAGSFVQFLPHYFDGWYNFGGNFAWMGLHLWYLQALFVFSVLTLPLLRFFERRRRRLLSAAAGAIALTPGAVFLLAIPIGVAEAIVNRWPDTWGMRGFGGWSLVVYLVIFLVGCAVAADERMQNAVAGHRLIALVLAIGTTTVLAYLVLARNFSTRTPVISFARAFNCWFWLVAILGFGSRYLQFNRPVLKYLNEAVLPFYMLHQTVIVVLAYSMIDLPLGIGAKYVILLVASFAAIAALYELLIRRLVPLRVLFGMKPLST